MQRREEDRRIELRIEIEPGFDSIEGVVRRPGAPAQAFVGWMALVELIASAAGHVPGSAPDDADDH